MLDDEEGCPVFSDNGDDLEYGLVCGKDAGGDDDGCWDWSWCWWEDDCHDEYGWDDDEEDDE